MKISRPSMSLAIAFCMVAIGTGFYFGSRLRKNEPRKDHHMATEIVQMKVSGLMCSFCTMSVEKALKRRCGVKNVMVNLVHGIVLVEADARQISRADLAAVVESLGYDVSATERSNTRPMRQFFR